MGRYKNRRELKAEAKELLSGRWKDAILLNMIPVLLTIIVMAISLSVLAVLIKELMIEPASYAPPADNSGSGSTITGIVSAFLTIGISYTFLDWLRNPEMQIRPFKQAFQVFTKKYFLGTLLVYIFTAIFTILWTLLLVVPGIIKTFSYSQAYFIFKDRKSFSEDEKVSALGCITESRKMMDGHKWEYFVLQLSFIGWGILSVLSFGIGFIWLNPYMNATLAAFYKNLTENDGYDESVEVF
ncbi:Uncharacterized membrane protein [Carnobacterium iners]|uniref:Uncharacterized membrane protein n=1 Tax=Carnobacterium iners TaxID=1073423 RepID=A0A1X7MQQ0_9LACT|nr:DUF975 family protein [Carnobacterium iners]SEL24290.1 Uncharacterized membrane protein [Carnobacterium iners]SMH27015.1 Uncharacterized membrane protein [Carnobacterium iners]